MQILMSSRRTVMSGEVVTFATSFERKDGAFGAMYEAQGPFEVSASRDAVMVHRAECRDAEDSAALVEAVECAEAVRSTLAPHWRGGHPSMFPDEPTPTAGKTPNAEVSGCLRAPMPEDASRTAAGSPLDRPVGPVAGA